MQPLEVKEVSDQPRCTSGLNWLVDEEVISLEWRKPENTSVKADHISFPWGWMSGTWANLSLIWQRSTMVMGRQRWEGVSVLCLMPHTKPLKALLLFGNAEGGVPANISQVCVAGVGGNGCDCRNANGYSGVNSLTWQNPPERGYDENTWEMACNWLIMTSSAEVWD